MSKKRKTFRYYFDHTLDLHGYILEDAILELERVIYSGKYRTVLVIHGLGLGILKRGIREYLASCTYVKKYHFGEDLNLPGQDGVTLIEI